MGATLSDDPISKASEDQLDRARFAKELAKLILNAPAGSGFRIGVYGDWGEGKTSVLRLMETELRAPGHPCVWFVPWAERSSEAMWEGLIREVTRELRIDKPALKAALKGEAWLNRLREVAGDIDWRLKLADNVIGRPLQKVAGKIWRKGADRLLAAIYATLGDRKLTVFVDDIDRASPDLVPGLLLALREALNLPEMYYVLALSPKVVAEGLRHAHPGWQDPGRFLEKIVEWPAFLPQISEQRVEHFVRAQAERLGEAISVSALEGIAPLLPRNPRKAKLFLRYLVSLRGQLGRFREDEVDFDVLYLCQLLALEFQEQTRSLASDSDALSALEAGPIRVRWDSATEEEPAETRHAPDDPESRERFLEICGAIRQRGLLTSRHGLRQLLLLLQEPPMLTWKELVALLAKFSAADEPSRGKLVEQWLKEQPGRVAMRAAALFDLAVELRQTLLGNTVGSDTEEEIRGGLVQVRESTQLLRTLIEVTEVFKKGLVPPESWAKLVGHLSEWSKWRQPDYYREVRDEEIGLLTRSTEGVPEHAQAEMLGLLQRMKHGQLEHDSEELEAELKRIKERFTRTVSDLILRRFETSDGISAFWGERDRSVEKEMAFDRGSAFHSPDYRARLIGVAERASTDSAVHKNFLTYFRMLAFGATDPSSSFSATDCRELLRDEALTKTLWQASLSRPLNRRTVGSLRQARQKLIEQLGLSPDAFPTTKWWDEVEQTFPADSGS